MKKLSIDDEIFSRGVTQIATRDELAALLQSGRPLRIKHGIDATGTLHIGHAVTLWKMRALQEAGHKAVIVLGEFTTQVGDPTGRSKTRTTLSHEDIQKNVRAIKKQIEGILLTDSAVYEVRKNSEWFGRMKTAEFLGLLSLVTHARLIERDMFQERISAKEEIAMSEMLYPILQGYDSVAIKSDIALSGSDQLFNEHMGRFFQERFNMPPQVLITFDILPGLDGGAKMSKSLGNYIGLDDTPEDMFGRAMRVLDELIVPYMTLYTAMPTDVIAHMGESLDSGSNPKDIKLVFAKALVQRYHGEKAGEDAERMFLETFSKKSREHAPSIAVSNGEHNIIDLLLELSFAESKSEARRLILQGAAEIDEVIITDPEAVVETKKGMLVRVGKRRFARIK